MNNTTPIRSQKSKIHIGKTTYNVTTTFSENATETIEDKFAKYVADCVTGNINVNDEVK